jgi:hypothetical protein
MSEVELNKVEDNKVEDKETVSPTSIEVVKVSLNPTLINTLIDNIEDAIHGDISAMNIFSITLNLMQLVEKYPKLTGPQKKALVIQALDNVIKKHGADQSLLALIPPFIDSAISIDKGKVTINVEEAASGCLSFCCK